MDGEERARELSFLEFEIKEMKWYSGFDTGKPEVQKAKIHRS